MSAKQKLELTWIGKEKRPQLEPRILMADDGLSHHAGARVSDADRFDNLLIQGDNLLALKALEAEFAGRVKCIYIDPPYNTGSAFEHYDDGVEHSVWLTLMRDRLEMLRSLLTEDGSIWINIDDGEAHYLKVLCDEVYGRSNFLANVVWEKADSPRMDAEFFSSRHDHILIYARDRDCCFLQRLTVEVPDHYSKTENDGRKYYLKPLRAIGPDGTREARPSMYFPMTAPDGKQVWPKNQDGSDSRWRWGKERVEKDRSLIEWVQGRNGWSPYYKIYANEAVGRPPETIWQHTEVGSNRTAKVEAKTYVTGVRPFDTPKPEGLIYRILQIATDPGDLVLDSFAGSGTTGAVAHKMGRRWIMVEQGDHAVTHIVPRLKKVIDGADPGGITDAAGWKGGGGYRFFRLAPSLLEKDPFDNWVISKKYKPEMLAEAVCKHMGFTYAPSTQHYWMHGHSSERDFIYVTTQSLPHDQLKALSDAVGPERSLLVCCKAFQGAHVDRLKNLTVKKIPLAILHRCEWGKDDYSLSVAALTPVEQAAAPEQDAEAEDPPRPRKGRKKKAAAAEPATLFDLDEEGA